MTHSYDVIYDSFKKRVENRKKMVISRNSHLFPILNAGKPFSFKNRFRYFLFFVKKLSEGQEIVHMIKSAENDNLETQT